MKNRIHIFLFLPVILIMSCANEPEGKVSVVKFNSVEKYLNRDNDTVYVINFWATRNKESVGQLPELEKIRKEFKGDNVKVLFISLDKPEDKDSKVFPVIKKLDIHSNVLLLDDPDTKSWRPKVSPLWNGQLPATLIYQGHSAEFYQESLNYTKLKSILDDRLKNKE